MHIKLLLSVYYIFFEDKMPRHHRTRHRVCMISDFFYPNMGGVETHIWCLSQCLLHRGHKVVVVTHDYSNPSDGTIRQGVRYMTNGLKVYYLPLATFYDQVALPTFCSFFQLFRNILIREKITIVHGHQSTSTLTNEAVLYARTMGYHVCYTDHSLFGFADVASIHINKVLQITMSDIDHVICVSNTCRENLVLRASLHPTMVSTIPNAVDATKFLPDPSKRFPKNSINIVLISRLVYRKGIDLLVKLIPIMCQKFADIHFIIGGDGPKKLLLQEMRERCQLHDRVELLGAVPHHQVRDVLVRGHIFLNCSLTESFCIALLEAASCGLYVVSTRVGGVPEVLPSSMISFAEPNILDLERSLTTARTIYRKALPNELHEQVKTMYSWLDVSERTEVIYNRMLGSKIPSLATRYIRYSTAGMVSGIIAVILATLLHFLLIICEQIWPESSIEICPDLLLPGSPRLQDHQGSRRSRSKI